MAEPAITARRLNRATLARQTLLQRQPVGAAEAVRRAVAVQAQEPASPYVALWNRVSDFQAADLDAAFTAGEVVKATLMRITLHAVHVDDYRVFREAMEPSLRASRLHDARFAASGLSLHDADAVVPAFVEFAGEPRTVAECEAWLEQRLGAPSVQGAWWAFRQYAPLVHVPGGGSWSFGSRRSFVGARRVPNLADPKVIDESLQTLVKRYLEGFGPASVADLGQFAMVHRSRIKTALQALDDDLQRLEGRVGSSSSTSRAPNCQTSTRRRRRGCWRCGTARCSPTPTGAGSFRPSCANS